MLRHGRDSFHGTLYDVGVLRSISFAGAVLLTAGLLLLANLGLWALVGLQDGATFGRVGAAVLERPEVRALVARRLAERLAPVVVRLAPLEGSTRRALGIPAEPTVPEAETALRHHLETYLADPATLAAMDAALGDVRSQLASQLAAGTIDGASLDIDLGVVVRAYADRLDPTGALADRVPEGLARLPLVGAPTMASLEPFLETIVGLRWLLPLACVAAMATVIVLARHRAHAFAWLGLAGVVVGTSSLLVASAAPLVLPRLTGVDTVSSVAVTGALQVLTAGLVVQSALIAVVGLALVVAGIAASTVTGDRSHAVTIAERPV
ncbi:MAG: hypothetical protein KF809_04550 [Chloroflexi bacterium]|nr:hypothetical protein [Chloroflexota bacterium]